MGVFYTTRPGFQMFLKEGTEEYHIYYDIYEDYSFTYTYKNVTSNDFIDDVLEYLLDKFEDKLLKYGTDTRYSEDGAENYIWIHVDKDSAKQNLTDILDALEKQFDSHWRFQRIPTLIKLVQNKLNISKVLAYAVSDFQRRRGVVETQDILHVFFNDINSS